MTEQLPESKCELCGHPMPPGEEMFVYHGYSGPCPGPPLQTEQAPKLEPHQERVVQEKKELDEKAKKLSDFIGLNPIFGNIEPAEQERLKEQCEVMWQYSEILGKRIAAFVAG